MFSEECLDHYAFRIYSFSPSKLVLVLACVVTCTGCSPVFAGALFCGNAFWNDVYVRNLANSYMHTAVLVFNLTVGCLL